MNALPCLALVAPALLVLSACGPVSPERAYEQCSERARAATGPQGRISVSGGTRGVSTGVEIGLSSDFIAGRDPYDVYDTCFRNLTGSAPTRPLVL